MLTPLSRIRKSNRRLATTNRMPAPRSGGIVSRPTLIASQVEPQIRQISANARMTRDRSPISLRHLVHHEAGEQPRIEEGGFLRHRVPSLRHRADLLDPRRIHDERNLRFPA